MVNLDDLDLKILAMLQKDGRAAHSEIARQLGVGHTRVRDHVMRMEEMGVITGYRVVVDPSVLGFNIQCMIHVEVDQQEDYDEFVKQLLEMEEVVEITNITGEYDCIVRVWLTDTDHLRQFLYERLSKMPAHKSTISNLVLNRVRRPISLQSRLANGK
ncbi:MAG: Lrp/AsnC family transcriptional regulator [Chloroflexota bacterium]